MQPLRSGKKYRVSFKIPGLHRTPRQMVALFVQREGTLTVWSGRPEFGTTELEEKWIEAVIQVADNIPCKQGKG